FSAQPSFPPLLAIVTLTVFGPPACPDPAGLDWLLEWLHAASGNTAAATKTVAVSDNSRDRHAARAVRLTINRFPLIFVTTLAAHRGYRCQRAHQREAGKSQRHPDP